MTKAVSANVVQPQDRQGLSTINKANQEEGLNQLNLSWFLHSRGAVDSPGIPLRNADKQFDDGP